MRMKRMLAATLIVVMLFVCVACNKTKVSAAEPQASQMRAICELAVMECYYHNVAKYEEEDAAGILWWQKDKHFWIEYSGVVKIGIDASLVDMEISGTQVNVTLPPAKVLGCTVDDQKPRFIVDGNSAKITAEDEVAAWNDSKKKMEQTAAGDTALLASAQQRAQALLEGYITSVGEAAGKEYTIKWVYMNGDTAQSTTTATQTTVVS